MIWKCMFMIVGAILYSLLPMLQNVGMALIMETKWAQVHTFITLKQLPFADL